MTTFHVLGLLFVPAAGLTLGLWVFWLNRREAR